jgi:hypothetical protein
MKDHMSLDFKWYYQNLKKTIKERKSKQVGVLMEPGQG